MKEQNNDIDVLAANREKTIVKTSIIGILTNVLLVGFKAFVGLMSNSIAIILDAVNNLSDALSSVVTQASRHWWNRSKRSSARKPPNTVP